MNQHIDDDGMREEYDFSQGVRGKHHKAFREHNNLVYLEPDVARAFPNAAAVNRALRAMADAAREQMTDV